MKKNCLILVSVVLVLGILAGAYLIYNSSNKDKKEVEPTKTVNEQNTDNQNLGNDEYEIVEEEQEIEHNLKLTIIGPKEDTMEARQARMYNALAEGNGKYSNQVKCHWDFYLNENNEEVLYQTMDNSAILSGESKEVCGFTSTFIEKRGVLRVVLTMTVYDRLNPELETVTAERMFTVL